MAAATPLAAAAAQPAEAGAVTHDKVERQVVRLINGARHHRGKRSLRLSRRMSVGATRHSIAMARTGTAAHGASWYSRVSRYAHSRTVGEVIAYVRTSSSRQARWVFNAWMHSPTHRAVILDGRFDRAGIGRRAGHGRWYFTLDTAN
jgi:uncharacterized protein YkwD